MPAACGDETNTDHSSLKFLQHPPSARAFGFLFYFYFLFFLFFLSFVEETFFFLFKEAYNC